MGWMLFKEYRKPRLKSSIALFGFPGIGRIGKSVVSYIIDQLEATKLFELYSEDLYLPGSSVGIMVEDDGIIKMPSIEAYLAKSKRNNVILITGDVQPVPWAQYSITTKILQYLKRQECNLVVSLSGFLKPSERGAIYILSNNSKVINELTRMGARTKRVIGSIIGMAGVSLATAKIEGMPYLSMTTMVENEIYDLRSAKKTILLIDKWLGLGLSYDEIDKSILEMEYATLQYERAIQQALGSKPEGAEYVG
ncbi:MAG: hypothetical protein B6U94_08480 [Thermofilum sp. ex4484_79]|nr:MAG: hypothetical protein B6U94_08480 [Thermofilum sp. ex4484_79]